MKIRPLFNLILVTPLPDEQITKGKIVLPNNSQKEMRGKVVAAGPGKWSDSGVRIPMSVKIGDIVCFNRFAGADLETAKNKTFSMAEDNILGIIEED